MQFQHLQGTTQAWGLQDLVAYRCRQPSETLEFVSNDEGKKTRQLKMFTMFRNNLGQGREQEKEVETIGVTSVIQALRRLRQEDQKFQTSLGCTANLRPS